MRTCSEAPRPLDSNLRNSDWTSQTACARKASSNSPARNWGRPKRWRVKNPVIRLSRVFYHERARLRKLVGFAVVVQFEKGRLRAHGRSLVPLVKTRNFGITPEGSRRMETGNG